MPRARRTHRGLQTFAGALAKALADEREALAGIRWPSSRYAGDPVGFAHDILGLTVWPGMQRMREAPHAASSLDRHACWAPSIQDHDRSGARLVVRRKRLRADHVPRVLRERFYRNV